MIERCIASAVLLLSMLAGPADAARVEVGPYVPSSTMPFVVPIVVLGAIDLATFTFDLSYDAHDVRINTGCDPFAGDPFCDLVTGPITQGTFFTDRSMFPPLFNPGFVLLDLLGTQTGRLLAVDGAWQDAGPGPSGDGILAYVEFIAASGGTGLGPIRVVDNAVPEPAPIFLVVSVLALMRSCRRATSTRRNGARSGLALGVLASGLLLASPASAQSAVAGPYYAAPAWDQTLPAASRFLVLANMNGEAVLDRETGLVWTRSPTPEATYASARRTCIGSKAGGRGGWRLPAMNELASLFDVTATSYPGLPAGHPFTDLPPAEAFYWTTTNASEGSQFGVAVITSFLTGSVVVSLGSSSSVLLTQRFFCTRSAGSSGV